MASRPTFADAGGASIQPLPADVVAQLKSSTAITSLSGVVLGLIENALDAGATSIEGLVDFARGGCTLEDNGKGIAPCEFRAEGGLGKLYHTSKYFSSGVCLGRHGTFLASLVAVSLLTITSHHHEHRSHNSITLHHSNVVERRLPAPARQELKSGDHGTRVTVRNLFGNLPVRVKQRAMISEQKMEHDRLWDSLKGEIVGLLLSWKHPVSLRLRDVDYVTVLSFTNQPSSYTTVEDNISKNHNTRTELQRLLNVITQAGWITVSSWPTWVPVSASTSNISIKGAMSLEPAPTKRIQFISLGLRPLSAEAGHNVLYDEVNRLFGLSSFGTEEDDGDVEEAKKTRRSHDRRFKKDGYSNRQLRGRKGVDRYAMFYLRIFLAPGNQRVTRGETLLDNEANIQAVTNVLRAMITQWLSIHHFRPRKLQARRAVPDSASPSTSHAELGPDAGSRPPQSENASRPRSATPTTRKRKPQDAGPAGSKGKSRELSPFRDWSRIKSGSAGFYHNIWAAGKASRPSTTPPTAMDSASPSGISPFNVQPIQKGGLGVEQQNPNEDTLDGHKTEHMTEDTDARLTWRDPITKQLYVLNARTGCVVPEEGYRPQSGSSTELERNRSKLVHKAIRLPKRPESTDSAKNTWLNGLLRSWENPIFKPTEQPIPQVTQDDYDACNAYRQLSSHPCSLKDIQKAFNGHSLPSNNKMTRAGLRKARIIAQLDRKFILVKMPMSREQSGSLEEEEVLVLVDQHAADERIRVEILLAELCTPLPDTEHHYRSSLGYESAVTVAVLEKPLQFSISTQEGRLFRRHGAAFATWGIMYDIDCPRSVSGKTPRNEGEMSLLSVTALPPGVSERCRADPKLLISLLRSTIWKYAEAPPRKTLTMDERQSYLGESTEESPLWVQRLPSCPQGLVDMINSRACRSAIMFNDELTIQQCEELVAILSRCAFPFMCAHGRPSMVPLISLAGGAFASGGNLGLGSSMGDDVGKKEDFRQAWKKWKQA